MAAGKQPFSSTRKSVQPTSDVGFFLRNVMDTDSTEGLGQELILELIHRTEEKYPSLKQENESILDWCGTQEGQELLRKTMPDLNAALISDCRTDPLHCGRCNFHWSVKKHSLASL